MYLLIIIDGDGDDEFENVNIARFWILSPRKNDDVPIESETTVRIF